MPSVTIILTDTTTGGVSVKTDFTPAIGSPCSAAQSAALDIINRTRHAYGLEPKRVDGIDIDAVHRTRGPVIPPEGITSSADARQ
jgi:hypothetical protein